MDATLQSLLEQLPGYAVKIVGVIVLFIVGKWIAGWLASLVQKSLDKRDFDRTLGGFFATMTRVLVLIVVILACLSVFGIETTSVAAVLGAAVFAVGLALQGSLANFAAGIMLIVFRPFKVGDFVEVAGETGTVHEIGLFTTILDTPDKRRITVPNGPIFSGNIENFSFHEVRRMEVAVGVDYSADIDRTREVLESSIQNVPSRVPDGAHQVVLADLGGSSVDWKVRVWARQADFWACREQVVRAVKMALDEAGIGIPYPTMDVNLEGRLEGKDKAA